MNDSFSMRSSFVPDRAAGVFFPQESSARRLLKFIYFDAGGGHRSAATALRDVIADRFPQWDVELVNLFSDVLRPLDPVHRFTDSYHTEDIYNGILKRGWTYGFSAVLRATQKLIKLYTPEMEELMRRYWQGIDCPDLVVSLIPNFNSAMLRTLRQVYPGTPYVTVMTDLADCPPHFWQEQADHFIICGSEIAALQAKAAGYVPEHIFQTSGMILKPHFYRPLAIDRRRERRKLGLDPDTPVALIMFGGHGAKTAIRIVDRLAQARSLIQSIVMCGRNEKLRKKLAGEPNCHAVGFTADDVPYYMRLADFFIGKPGPGSLSEAVHMGLPVIIEHSRRTMPQERYNVSWVKEQEVGIVIKSFARVADAADCLLEQGRLEKFRRNAGRLRNYAVFEIPDILERIMNSP